MTTKTILRLCGATFLMSALAAPALAAPTYAIERIEPASWWTGMHNHRLQLMVHGDHVGALTPAVDYPGVTVTNTVRTDNPDYLFVDLEIGEQAAPGELTLHFSDHGHEVLSRRYPLQARAPHSAERAGFGPADAIYLVVPDRFANGDPGNDSVAGMVDNLNRSNPGGRHGGDLLGLRKHLDYIARMGYTMLWPTPLMENNQPYSYHGYAMTDLYKVDPHFGSNADYRQLVADAHAKGLGVIQDIVLNHIGANHWWMKDMPSRDWLNFPDHFVPTTHQRTTVQDPHASSYDRARFTGGWFSKGMPDLNQQNPLVATYLIQNSIWWIEYAGLSGIRTDTFSYSDKGFLANWSRSILDEYPHFSMVGEEWSLNPVTVSYWQKDKPNIDGYACFMPSMMDFPLMEALRQGFTVKQSDDSGLKKLYDTLAADIVYPHPDDMVIFEGNHDTSRIFSELKEDYAAYKMALVYLATMRGIPQFMYGTEILMKSPARRDDGIVRSDFPGGWAGDRSDAFSGKGLSAQQQDAQQFVRKLLNWRKATPAVQTGKLMHFVPEKGTYVYFRYDDKHKVMVAFNTNTASSVLATARFREVLGAHATATDALSGKTYNLAESVALPARSVLLLDVHE